MASPPVACRVHLRDSANKPVRHPWLPFWHDHFVCPGTAALELPAGEYTYEIERGPEWIPDRGRISLGAKGKNLEVRLRRQVNMAARGWWSGDLHVHRPPEQVELLMAAEDLHVAPVITWWNNRNWWQTNSVPRETRVAFDRNRYYDVMGGEDERQGGALLFFHLPKPLPITGAGREYPSPMAFVDLARREKNVWIDLEKPFWWDVPTWVALGAGDSIGLANNHMARSQMYESEAWGRPRDTNRLAAPRGNGFWTQEIYYHLLNSGLRLPPSAGSASGVLPNPVGYNRVYVQTRGKLDYDEWWAGLRAGRSFVSNGPLLLGRANGRWPGHIFRTTGKPLALRVECELWSNDPVRELEIIKDGAVDRRVPVRPGKASRATVTFERSGWFLVRAIAEVPHTFRFASTAPFYVEIGDERRISRASAQFFLDWVRERMPRVNVDDAGRRGEVLRHHEAAEKFWGEKVQAANAP